MTTMFPATQWTDLARASLHGDHAGRAALESLCRNYWEPVRQVARMQPWAREDSEDLAQSFFLYIMEQNVLHQADRSKGKFRSFLQSVLNRWLIDEYRRRTAQRRGGGQSAACLEELPESIQPSEESNQAELFDQHWARSVMQTALARIQAEYSAKHGEEASKVLGAFLGAGGEAGSYEEASKRLNLSLANFKSEVLSWRRKLRDNIRAEVRRTVSAPHEIDEEMNYLRGLLAAGPQG